LATHHRGKQKCLGILARAWQHAGQPGFFLRILWYSQGGDHSKTILANSGYMPDMKVEKNQDPSIFLALPTGTSYCRNLVVWIFFLFEIWQIWTIFPMKIPLYWSKPHFSSRIFCKIFLPIKKTLDTTYCLNMTTSKKSLIMWL
jgi:hypothetical protein